MTTPTFGISVYVNGAATSTGVLPYTAQWETVVANVNIRGGGGTWVKPSTPFVADVDFYADLHDVRKVRTISIAVTGPFGAGIMPYFVEDSPSVGLGYRIIFQGTVIGLRAQTGSDLVRVTFADPLAGFFNQRLHLAASNNSGIRTLLSDLFTASNIASMTGYSGQFPSDADYFNLDRPAQGKKNTGAYVQEGFAGSEMNLCAAFDGDQTLIDTNWLFRPDYFATRHASVATTNRMDWDCGYPWLMQYKDLGYRWGDSPARVVILGEDSAGTKRYGRAYFGGADIRRDVGNRDITLTSWIDNGADLADAADHTMGHMGYPDYYQIERMSFPLEFLHQTLDADPNVADADREAMVAATLQLGDRVIARTPFDNTNTDYKNWPTTFPASGSKYDDLEYIWNPLIKADSAADAANDGDTPNHVVRYWERTWNPHTGWDVTLGIQNVGRSTGFTSGSGTY